MRKKLACCLAVAAIIGCAASSRSWADAGDPGPDVPPEAMPPALEKLVRPAPSYRQPDRAAREHDAAFKDHMAVVLGVSRCYADLWNPLKWSPATRLVLHLDSDQSVPPTVSQPNQALAPVPSLQPFHAGALAMSDRIARERVQTRKDLEEEKSALSFYSFLSIALGAATTIMIGLRTTVFQDSEGNAKKWLGAAAILVSASTTGVSSLAALDTRSAHSLRTEKTLASLQQLHWRVATDVQRTVRPCPDIPSDPKRLVNAAVSGVTVSGMGSEEDDSLEKINAWTQRLEQILDNSTDALARPGDLARPGPARTADPGDGTTAFATPVSLPAASAQNQFPADGPPQKSANLGARPSGPLP